MTTPRRVASLVAAIVLLPLTLLAAVAAPAAAQEPRTVEIAGRGWGHGRGLGQHGAYGYATDHGWSSAQILDHFYGGTTAGPVPGTSPVDPGQVRVELRYLRDQPTMIGLGQGSIELLALDGTPLGTVAAGAVRLEWNGDGYRVRQASSCSGPWSDHSEIAGQATVRLVASSTAPGADGKLHGCGSGFRTWYEGEMRAAVAGGSGRTVNVVTIEQYLRGVVPNEMPAFWPQAALEAQAVAARSYAMAGDNRQQPYADTCDTTLCQVYDGLYTDRGGFRQATHHRTDAAVQATAGLVRIRTNGTVARTEFSSSTGGYTAGGEFPAAVDDGDATSINPHRFWTVTIDVGPVEQRYGLGRLLAIDVVGRSGLGPDGGRVTKVDLVFEQGAVAETGTGLRTILGLKSDWFTPGPVGGTDLRASHTGTYIDGVYQRLAGRPASDGEIARWYGTVSGGDRRALTGELVLSDHFAGRMVDDLYQRALGRPADESGRRYWVDRMAAGVELRSIGVYFYGSTEYFLRSGATNRRYVDALYRNILSRAPDPAGERYWTALLDNGAARLDDVAAEFYASLESRRQRAGTLHRLLLGPVVSAEVGDALAGRLVSSDDLSLAAEITASVEAYEAYGSSP